MGLLLAIDPSIRNLGWAVFHWYEEAPPIKMPVIGNDGKRVKPVEPRTGAGWAWLAEAGHITCTDQDIESDLISWDRWIRACDYMSHAVFQLAREAGVNEAILELPEVFGGGGFGGNGRAAAAVNTGALMKLTALVFQIREALSFGGVPVNLALVTMWKGQTPKEVTQRRVRKHWGWSGTDHNEADAVGLGGWLLTKQRGLQPRPANATIQLPTKRLPGSN